MNDKTHQPRKNMTFSVDRLETLLDSALEHASHGWTDFERQTVVNRINPDSWPPQVDAPVGSAQYHFATMLTYVFEAYGLIRKEQDHTEQVMEKVNKALGK